MLVAKKAGADDTIYIKKTDAKLEFVKNSDGVKESAHATAK